MAAPRFHVRTLMLLVALAALLTLAVQNVHSLPPPQFESMSTEHDYYGSGSSWPSAIPGVRGPFQGALEPVSTDPARDDARFAVE
jgi:hypothetical protein